MKSTKTQQNVKKSAQNTPNNQSGFTTRKNTQIISSGLTKDDVVSINKGYNQSQFSQTAPQFQNEQNQVQQKSNANSRIEYSQNINSNNPNISQNGRNPDFPMSQQNIDEQYYFSNQSQQPYFQSHNSQIQTDPDQSTRRILRVNKSESKLHDIGKGLMSSNEFNYSVVDNLIVKRGFAKEKVVPMELFQETMQYFERRLTGIEQRIEDNEQLVHLSDRLFELRSVSSNNASGVKDRQLQLTNFHSVQQQQMSPSGMTPQGSTNWSRGFSGDTITQTFGSAQTQKYNTSSEYSGGGGGFSVPSKQIESRVELSRISDQQNQASQITNNSLTDLQNKLQIVEKRVTQFDELAKSIVSDIEKKFGEYSKKLNVQIDKFFKNASQKMEQYGEQDSKLQNVQDTIQQQLDILSQTYILKQEELVINKEEINDNIKTISALISKLENRINEHSIDISESRILIKGIEDDFFIMLQNYKDLSEGVQNYRNISDDINFLKQNQSNILKNINISAIHHYSN